jgi:hypothetical protein
MTQLQDVIGYCERIADSTITGDADSLDCFAQMRAVILAAQDALNLIEPAATAQAERFEAKTFEHHGIKYTRSEGKTVWNYSRIPEWVQAKAQVKEIEETAKLIAKANQKKLIAATQEGEVVEGATFTMSKPSLSIAK